MLMSVTEHKMCNELSPDESNSHTKLAKHSTTNSSRSKKVVHLTKPITGNKIM